MLEVADRRRQALETLQRLLATIGIARAQRGAKQRFQEVRLAVGGGAEDAQVAGSDADPRELIGGADDFAVVTIWECETRAAAGAKRLLRKLCAIEGR